MELEILTQQVEGPAFLTSSQKPMLHCVTTELESWVAHSCPLGSYHH